MTDAVDTVLRDWAIPRMNVRHLLVATFKGGNEGSVEVFLRFGFKMTATYEDHYEVKGKIRGVHLLEWKYDLHVR
jgi:L-amino acid N-acyltransferase YncA